MDGGLASGVTSGSTWTVRPVGSSPQDTDARIKVQKTLAFVSHAEVICKGPVKVNFECFEVSHDYGSAVLNICVDSPRNRQFDELISQSDNTDLSGILNVVQNAAISDVKVAFLDSKDSWVAFARDGRMILPPTPEVSVLCENLRKLARYRFGVGLRNYEEHNELQGKVELKLRRRPKGSSLDAEWEDAPTGEDSFPHFQNGDHIACVVTNNSDVTVWAYVLEFAEDGSVHQRYPYYGGEEELGRGKSTKEIAPMALNVSNENAFQLGNLQHGGGGVPQRQFTEVLKLFASTERIDLSLLLQTSFGQPRGIRGLYSLLRLGQPFDGRDICSWWTVEQPFVLESDRE
jgi:hypothetical protein